MITDTTKLKTKNWQHKRNTIGEIACDVEDVAQCIRTIATVQKGSVPFASNFGCEIIESIGENPLDSIENLTIIYTKEIPRQEPRCEIIDLLGEAYEDGRLKMTIYFRYILNNLTGKTEVFI